ncbi:MAG TPA: hypothetical protein VIF62_23750, partial [Labilithrix sp.]
MVSLESPLRAGATQAFPGGGLETYTEGSMIGSRSRVRGRVTALRVERDVVRFAVDLEAIDGGR